MFQRIIRRLKGLVSLKEAQLLGETYLTNAIKLTQPSEDEWLMGSKMMETQYYELWHWLFVETVPKAFSGNNRYEQMINLRREILDNTDNWIGNKIYWSSNFTEKERQIISKSIFQIENIQDNDEVTLQCLIIHETNVWVLRMLSYHYFYDLKKNDYLTFYVHMVELYFNNLYRAEVSCCHDEDNSLSYRFLPMINNIREGIRKTVLEGGNYQYDREEIEQENTEYQFAKLKSCITDDY
jgi:hypothetical protein